MTYRLDEGDYLLLVTYDGTEWEEVDRSDMFDTLEKQVVNINEDVLLYIIARVEETGSPLSDENNIEY
jgi:hypothetical protein